MYISTYIFMNKVIISLLLIVMIGIISCQRKSGQVLNINHIADSLNDSIEDQKVIIGIVKDTSMNNFMLVTSKRDTLFVSTMDQEPNEVGGFELGDTVKVNYIEEEEEPGLSTIPTAKKVVVVGKGNQAGK